MIEPATRLLLIKINEATQVLCPIRLGFTTPRYTEEEWEAVLKMAREKTGFSHDRATEIVEDLMEYDNFMQLVRMAHEL